MGPGSTFVGFSQTPSKQVLDQSMLGAALIGLRSGPLANQISQRLVLGGGHPDGSKVAGLVRLGELLGIATIGCRLPVSR